MVVFSSDKTMIFPFVLTPSEVEFPITTSPRHLEDHLVARADRWVALGGIRLGEGTQVL
jgi:hypothetical protein